MEEELLLKHQHALEQGIFLGLGMKSARCEVNSAKSIKPQTQCGVPSAESIKP